MIGRNAYYLLRRLMHSYNIDPQRGIKEWQCRMYQLNGYTKYLPSDLLEKQNKVKEEFTKIAMRELLSMAASNSYHKKLEGNDWNIYEEPFMKSVDKLITYEPDIKEKAAKAKSDKELADKVYGTKGTKRNKDGTPKVAEADKIQCKHCEKKHKENAGNWKVVGATRSLGKMVKPFNKK